MARVHPGDLVGDRYLVFDQTDENWGVCAWRARDEVLGREVLLTTFHPEDPRTASLVTAAQHAATVHDHRFIRVLDAHVDRPTGYLVREWVGGQTLADMLATGPLDEPHTVWLVTQVAEALARAHEHGLSHLCMDPNSVLIDADGAVRVKGLGTAAVLRGVQPSRAGAAQDDAEGIGVVLYAALTGMLPRPTAAALPVVRTRDRTLPSPRQVRAGVSSALSTVAMRALGWTEKPYSGPAEVATALRRIGADEGSEAPAMSLATSGLSAEAAEHSLLTSPPRQVRPALEPDAAGRAALPAPVSDPADLNPARAERRWLRRALVSVAIALGIGVFLLSLDLLAANRVPDLDGDSGAPGGAASDEQGFSEPDAQPAPPPEALTERPIVRAADYDPYGNGTENADRTSLAIDSDVGTVWPTQVYYDPLELQKPGVGVLLDLGRPVEVASVDLVLAGAPSDVSVLLTPPDAQQVPPTPDGFVEFGTVSAAPESVTVMGQPQRSRYVLVWYTRLPQVPDGWRGGVAEVVVRG